MPGPIPIGGPFSMPMFRSFVPKPMQPWIFVVFVIIYQLTSGVYLASLSQMFSGLSLLREDIMMCGYAHMLGLVMPFPVLFRLKFRFTNRQIHLLCVSVLLVCNFTAMLAPPLPVLWFVCFVSGWFKLWGTFECMSNIQLWMTPKRDFTIFFPLLYILILGDLQWNDVMTTYVAYFTSWRYVHLFVIGLLLTMGLAMFLLLQHFRFMKPMPLISIDLLGGMLWAATGLQLAWLFGYGEHYGWLASPLFRFVVGTMLITLSTTLGRMRHIRHPYISPRIFGYRRYLPVILLYFLTELLSAPASVLQPALTTMLGFQQLNLLSLNYWGYAGIVFGGLVSLLWMAKMHYSYVKLINLGLIFLALSTWRIYSLVGPDTDLASFYLPTFLRTASSIMLCCAFSVYVQELLPFEVFFQGFPLMNLLHNAIGASAGGALYAFGLRYGLANNAARLCDKLDAAFVSTLHLEPGTAIALFGKQDMLVSLQELYGWTIWAILALMFVLVAYDSDIRSTLKRIPTNEAFGRQMWRRMKRWRGR